MKAIILALLAASSALAAPADKPAKEKERQAEHKKGSIVIKKKDKSGNWNTERECRLMFGNNRLADKPAKEKQK